MGVNPSSGEKMFIPPHKGLSFRPSRRLVRPVKKDKQGPRGEAAERGRLRRR